MSKVLVMARLKALIIGGGRTTELLLSFPEVRELFEEIIIVEKNSSRRHVLERLGDVLVLEADALNTSIYSSSINMREISIVLALADRDEVNFFALGIAKAYEVPIRIGLFSNPETAEVVKKLQLGLPICRHTLITSILKYMLMSLTEAIALSMTGEEKLYAITISESDTAVNVKLEDLKLEEDGAKPIFVLQDSQLKPAEKDVTLTPGSVLFVLAPSDTFIKRIRG